MHKEHKHQHKTEADNSVVVGTGMRHEAGGIRWQKLRTLPLLFAVFFAGVGTYLILSSHAATPPGTASPATASNCAGSVGSATINYSSLDACGYPSPNTTGPRITPTAASGTVTCDSTHAVSGKSFNASQLSMGNGCTITDSKISGGIGGSVTNGLTGVVISYTEIAGAYTGTATNPTCTYTNNSGGTGGVTSDILWEGAATGVHVDHSYLHCAAEPFNGNGVVSDSYILSDECWGPCGSGSTTHNEGVYLAGGGSGGSDFEHNTILNQFGQTAGFFGDDHAFGPIKNLTVNNNLIAAGQSNGAIVVGNSGDGDVNVVITNNRLSFVYDANMVITGSTAAATWCGNFKDDTPTTFFTPSGGTNGAACSGGSTPAPTVSLTANPTSISQGGSSTLTWSVTNSTQSNPTSCSATSPSGWTTSTATSGSKSVSPTSTTTYQISCTGAGGTGNSSATVTVTLASGCFQASASWQNTSFAAQTSNFTFDFNATPSANNIDAVTGLNSGAATDYTSLAVIVRFNTSGTIDAVNGSSPGGNYTADNTVAYTGGTTYHFHVSVNPTGHTYSVVVTPNGGSAVNLATNYQFRSDQATLSSFNNWAIFALTGSHTVCGITVAAGGGGTVTGDLNGDSHVNVFDLSIFLTKWQAPNANGLPEDFNGDGQVNIFDLSILLANYGT